ncbi:MAG: hypothetical protein C0482_24370 [Gordonia sp.]|nr:hypothetical protein [Gordonia sp. (in: high G+C Gram-positive bacteria)]
MNRVGSELSDLSFADDLVVGSEYELGDYLVTAKEITGFAAQWDPLHIHADEALAIAGRFGSIISSGVHTFAVFQRLAVTAFSRSGTAWQAGPYATCSSSRLFARIHSFGVR